ncbi:MAG: hypothetical protein ACLFVB_10685 [Thermoplasmata archaeon]
MKTITNILVGLVLLATALALPFDTLFVDFTAWSQGAINILKLTGIAGSITYIARGVFR